MKELPGYYFNPTTRRYYKIENSHTAPPGASWSSTKVKQRKERAAVIQRSRERSELLQNHIKRSALQRDVVLGGLVSREVHHDYGPQDGRWRRLDEDIGAAAWAAGLREKGALDFAPKFPRSGVLRGTMLRLMTENMSCFLFGAGVAYATLDESTLVGMYISDKNDGITFARSPRTYPPWQERQIRREISRCPQLFSLKYHEPSHQMIIASRGLVHHGSGLFLISPLVSEDGAWRLGESNFFQKVTCRRHIHERKTYLTSESTPAPASADLICLVGSNGGFHRVRSDRTTEWAALPDREGRWPGTGSGEIFDQDFQKSNHNVVFAGGRRGLLWLTDARTPHQEWTQVGHASSINHLRSVNTNQVLVAGLENTMSLYDLRFLRQWHSHANQLLAFPEYKNAEHVQTGWDVCPDINAVAAAQDNGTVRLFSLASGRKLAAPALHSLRRKTPIKALMFRSAPTEKMPSLWAGVGQTLVKYSFGVDDLEDEA